MEIAQLVQDIQAVLAPAVMVSSAALLLLGLQAKFSNLASRFRGLHHERRLLVLKAERNAAEEERLKSVQDQAEHLMRRAACVKRAIMLSYIAIASFMGSSMLLFFDVFTSLRLDQGVVGVFIVGLGCVLGSALVMIAETRLFYTVLTLERLS
jgi:hypothetical protein